MTENEAKAAKLEESADNLYAALLAPSMAEQAMRDEARELRSRPALERCSLCGREAEDVEFDFLGPDSNAMNGERWDYTCGDDKGCNA